VPNFLEVDLRKLSRKWLRFEADLKSLHLDKSDVMD